MEKIRRFIIGALLVGVAIGVTLYRQKTPVEMPAQSATSAPMMVVKVPAQFGPLARSGEPLFNDNCASCHGRFGAGQIDVAPPLIHKIYEPGHHGDQAFFMAVFNGARAHHWPFGDMPPVEGLKNEDVEKIVAFVREIQRENGIF